MPCRATSIIPLLNAAPANTPTAATVTTADLLPDPETRRSRLYLRIPDYDPTCDLYDVRLVLPFHVRDVEADSIGPRDFYLMSLVIYPYKTGDAQ